jgi:hypothetical protein
MILGRRRKGIPYRYSDVAAPGRPEVLSGERLSITMRRWRLRLAEAEGAGTVLSVSAPVALPTQLGAGCRPTFRILRRSSSQAKLRGKQPKLTTRQQAELVRMHASGEYTIAELMEVFFIGRATVYRVLDRAKQRDSP